MSAKYTLGAITGFLAALTPFLTPAVVVVGIWTLYVHGVRVPGESATAGLLWASAWTAVFTGVLIGLVALLIGLWDAPVTTITVVGTIMALATVRRYMHGNLGGGRGGAS